MDYFSYSAAVMFSGGRDSLLAAAIAIEEGNSVVPVIFDNGHMDGTSARAMDTARLLRAAYPKGRVSKPVLLHTGMELRQLVAGLWGEPLSALGKEYPSLNLNQILCTACHFAMTVQAIAFCEAAGCEMLYTGARTSQGFFVQRPEARELVRKVCEYRDIVLRDPLLNLESDEERKAMLDMKGLPTKVLEPQCYLGCPLGMDVTADMAVCLVEFTEKHVLPPLLSHFAEMTSSLQARFGLAP